MDYRNLGMPSQTSMNAINAANKNRQKLVDAAQIEISSTAPVVAQLLYQEIIEYQNSLSNEEDIAIQVVKFNESITLLVESIGYTGCNLVWFESKDNNGSRLRLVQHVQQLNFLMMTIAKEKPELPKRKIGFVQD